jgi:hypothetical protein
MQLRPFTMLHYAGNVRSETVNTNRLGYRGTKPTAEYPDEVTTKTKFTIVLTGGSAAFGRTAGSDDASLAKQLEAMLSDFCPTEVVNLAMGGYVSFTQFVAVSRYGMMLSPDLIVVIDGYNDVIMHGYPVYREPPGYPCYFSQMQKAVLCYRPPDMGVDDQFYWAGLIKRSALARAVFHLRWISLDEIAGESERRAHRQTISDRNARRIVDMYTYSEELLIRLAGAHDCPVLLATQPLRGYPGEMKEMWRRELFRLYPRIIEAGRHVCNTFGNAEHVDLTQAMPAPNGQFFSDGVHLNAKGQRKLATIVAETIRTRGWLPVESTDGKQKGAQ